MRGYSRNLLNIIFLIFRILAMTSITKTSAQPVNDPATDWWKNAVIYQIYPRSFMDSSGDGVGDLRGIISKLNYLKDLGITATWLSPIFESPMVDFGYDISNFTAIQEEYGSMQDFEDLIDEANKLGIKIMLDFVPNHSSDQCDWFKKSVERVEGYEDFYIWSDGIVNQAGEPEPPNNWQSVFYGSAWTWNDQREQFYLHQFTVQQPDLNYRNPKVIEAMDGVLRFWLDKGVSGFRVDAVNHLFESKDLLDEPLTGLTYDRKSYDYTKHIYTKDLPEVYDMLHHWRQLIDDYTAENGGATRIFMTEAYADVKTLMKYYENPSTGEQGAHFPFNFLLLGGLNKESDAHDFVYNIQKWLAYMPRGHVANWVLGNHDNPRIASRFNPELVDALNMMLMTLSGVAVTYNGEELGMQDYRDISWEDTVDPPARNSNPKDYKKFSRDPERTPFQWDDSKNAGFSTADKTWLPVHPNYKQLNLKQQQAADKSSYHVYKKLVELRKMPTLLRGRFQAEVLSHNVFAYKRELKGEPTLVVVINLGATLETVDLSAWIDMPAKLTVLVAGVASSYVNGEELSASALNLAPFEGLVCTLEYTAE